MVKWSKEVIETINQIMVRMMMHGKGIGLDGNDHSCTTNRMFYDGNSHQLDISSWTKKRPKKNAPVFASIDPSPWLVKCINQHYVNVPTKQNTKLVWPMIWLWCVHPIGA